MKLADAFRNSPATSLVSESDTVVVLSIIDPATSAVSRVEIRADMVALPDEAMLAIRIDDDYEASQSVGQPMTGIDADDRGRLILDDSNYLPPTWAITPDGQEFTPV